MGFYLILSNFPILSFARRIGIRGGAAGPFAVAAHRAGAPYLLDWARTQPENEPDWGKASDCPAGAGWTAAGAGLG